MGAFEDFVNANLGVRMPLFIDTTTPASSSIAAGSLGSKFVDSTTNYLYEKTGYTNADWVKIAELGETRGGSGSGGSGMLFSNFTGGMNIEISGDDSLMKIFTPFTLTGSGIEVYGSGVIGTGSDIPFAVSESGQVGLNLYTGGEQTTGYVTPYHFHVSGVTALSGSSDIEFSNKPALTVVGNTEMEVGAIYPSSLTTAQRNSLSLLRGGSGALVYNSDSNQLEINNGSTWRTLSGGALGSGVGAVANIGAGSGIASGVVDDTASFKSLVGGTNLQILGDENSLTLNVTGIVGDGSGSGITGAFNIGAGSGVVSGVVDKDAYFKSLVGGTNLQILGDENSLTLNVTGISGSTVSGLTGAYNLGSGSGIFSGISNNDLVFRTIEAGPNVSITESSSGLKISASTTSVTVTGGTVSGGLGSNPYVTGQSNFYSSLPDQIVLTSVSDNTSPSAFSLYYVSPTLIYYSRPALPNPFFIIFDNNASATFDSYLNTSSAAFGAGQSISGYVASGRGVYLGGGSGSSSSTTGITGVESLGAGSALASGILGSDLMLKSLVGGTNVTLSSDDSTITIDAAGGGGGGSSSSGGFSANSLASGWSNFHTTVPDALLIEIASNNTGIFTINQIESSINELYYENRYFAGSYRFISFKNTSSGEVGTYNQGTVGSISSLSGLVESRQALYYGGGSDSSSSTTGITGASNIGAGSGLISGIVDNDLQVKSLVGGTNLQITGDGESLYLNVTGVSGSTVSGITGASNIGVGSGILSGISNNDLVFRTIEGGSNVSIVESNSGWRINASTTSVTVTGGTVSGGVGSNPFVTGASNFYTLIPDEIILENPSNAAVVYTFSTVGNSPSSIYYTQVANSASNNYLVLDNDSIGTFDSKVVATHTPALSLSGYIASGRAVYLGGGSGSSSSTTGITGASNIGAGSGIVSGVVDKDAYFKSLIGGTNLQILGDENSLTLNVTGISAGGSSSCSGGIGANTGVQALSNFYKDLPDNLYVNYDSAGTSKTVLSMNHMNASHIYYRGGVVPSDTQTFALKFSNSSSGELLAVMLDGVTDSPYTLAQAQYSSLSGYIEGGTATYLGGCTGSSSSTTRITGASNLGAGSAIVSGISSNDLKVKSLVGGTNVTLSSDDSTITIDAAGGGGGGTSLGVSVKQGAYVGDGQSTGMHIDLGFDPCEVFIQCEDSPYWGQTRLFKTHSGQNSLYRYRAASATSTWTPNIAYIGTVTGNGFLALGHINNAAFNHLNSNYTYIATSCGTGSAGGGSTTSGGINANPAVAALSNFTGILPDQILLQNVNPVPWIATFDFYGIEKAGGGDQLQYRCTYDDVNQSVTFDNDSSGKLDNKVSIFNWIDLQTPNCLQDIINSGHAVFFGGDGSSSSSSSTTGITGASNIGAGSGLISGILDNDLQVKSLVGGTNLQITGDGESLYLNVTGISGSTVSGLTGVESLGAGSALASGILESDLRLKSLVGGTNVTLSSDDSTITIDAAGGGGGGAGGDGPGNSTYYTGFSNFYTELPDWIAVKGTDSNPIFISYLSAIDGGSTFRYSHTVDGAVHRYVYNFNNNASGTFNSYIWAGGAVTETPSLSGLLVSGRAGYMGGGSGSSSSITGITGASNIGAGSGLISGILDNDLQVKSLVGGTNLQITGDGESLYLNVTGVSGSTVSGLTGASNIGLGSGILSGISDNDLVFRTIEAGPNVSITESSSGLKISASTTSVTVTGGTVSGGIGSNPFVTGASNFYTNIPDSLILSNASYTDTVNTFMLTWVGLDAITYTLSQEAAGYVHPLIAFYNNAGGSFQLFANTSAAVYGAGLSLSGYIAGGRAVYLGGGGSGSSSSTTGITGASNIGAGSAIVSGISSNDLKVKSLVGGTNVTLSSDDSTITIDAAGGGGGGSTSSGFANWSGISDLSNLYTGIPEYLYVERANGYTVARLEIARSTDFQYTLNPTANKWLSFSNDAEGTYSNGDYTYNGTTQTWAAGAAGGGGTGPSLSGLVVAGQVFYNGAGGSSSSSSATGITGAYNIGSGSGVFSGISDNDLVFRTIEAGPNVFITESSSGLKISASTTSVTVTGGSVSGGVGSNPFVTGMSNFYTNVPDQIILESSSTAAVAYSLGVVSPSYIDYVYEGPTAGMHYIRLDNDSIGTFVSKTVASHGPALSLSGYIASGRAVYLGGGSSSSSTSGITGVESLGAGSALASGISGSDLMLKSLVGGTNVTLSSDDSTITIDAAGGGGGGGGSSSAFSSNSITSGWSNFYTDVPDALVLEDIEGDTGIYTVNQMIRSPYNQLHYDNRFSATASHNRYIIFENTTSGELSSLYNITTPVTSLSGLVASGRTMYYGGGSSSSSSSSTSGINNEVINEQYSVFSGTLPNSVLVSGVGGSATSVYTPSFVGRSASYLMYGVQVDASLNARIDFNHNESGTLNSVTNCSTPYASLQEMINSGYAIYY